MHNRSFTTKLYSFSPTCLGPCSRIQGDCFEYYSEVVTYCINVQHHFNITHIKCIKQVIHITPTECTYSEMTQHFMCLLIVSACSWNYMNNITPCPYNKYYLVLICGSVKLLECLIILFCINQLFKMMQCIGLYVA